MGLLQLFGLQKIEKQPVQSTPASNTAHFQNEITYGISYPILDKKWDGEKTLGELGVVVRNIPDFQRLRLRSYNAFATIDTVKIIASKFFVWTIGSGLKLQAEPNRDVLESEGIINTEEDYRKFQKICESRFNVFANSKELDFSKERTLHEIANEAHQTEFLGGDFLTICRFDDSGLTVQVISGEHICNPPLEESRWHQEAKAKNHIIDCGIEINQKGTHVAYFVKILQPDGSTKFERLEAFGKKSKKRLVWLVAGNKISPDHLRSVPAMAQSLEKINKLDRYTEAAVTKEEQSAKIVYTIEHEEFSTGENPLMDKVQQVRSGTKIEPEDSLKNKALADGLANKITETTSGMTYNMPNGAKLKPHVANNASAYQEFHSTVFKSIAAGNDVPPEVAMQEYNSNYSASRAAINGFSYIIENKREKFAINFYKPIYELWLEHQILTRKIIAKGYLEGIDNFMITKSYSQCRFTGKNMPHIDPLKEAKSVELMLQLDLISMDQATEILGCGEWMENYLKLQEERKLIPKESIDAMKNITKSSEPVEKKNKKETTLKKPKDDSTSK